MVAVISAPWEDLNHVHSQRLCQATVHYDSSSNLIKVGHFGCSVQQGKNTKISVS